MTVIVRSLHNYDYEGILDMLKLKNQVTSHALIS